MSFCTLHPDRETGATCEYCTLPHCGDCLRPYLGRRYCPGCLARVESVATGKAPRKVQPVVAPGAQSASTAAAGTYGIVRTPIPGWLSALLFLGIYLGLLPIVLSVAQSPLLLVKLALAATGRAADLRDPMSIAGIGWGGWFLLFAVFTWGSFLLTLFLTAGAARFLEKRSLVQLGLSLRGERPWVLVAAALLGAVWSIAVVGIQAGRGEITLTPASDLPYWGSMLVLAPPAVLLLALPVAALEGTVLRGYVLHAFSRMTGGTGWGSWLGVAVSAVAFAALHGQNTQFRQHPWALLPLLLIGLFLAVQTVHTGSIWPSVLTWSSWLTVQLVAGLPVSAIGYPTQLFRPFVGIFRSSSTLPVYWSVGPSGGDAGVLVGLTALLALGAVTILREYARRKPTELPRPPAPQAPPRAIPLTGE